MTLALGIGANTAVFSLVNAVLLEPLPVDRLDRLVVIKEDMPGINLRNADLAPVEVLDLGARTDVFASVTGYRAADVTLTGFGEPVRLGAVSTIGDFAGVFALQPPAGRFYAPDTSGAPPPVAVIGHGLWMRIAGGDPSFVGRSIELNGLRHEVVGVMPAGFRFPADAEVWMPFRFTDRWKTNRGSLVMTTIGRRAPGVDDAQLEAGLASEVARWNHQYHAGSAGKLLRRTPLVEYLAGPLRLVLFVLMASVVFVLLIAAANVASLQLVRVVGRSREVAVRAAIGAGRGRLLRQFLIESAALSVAGGGLGLWLGSLGLDLLGRWPPAAGMRLTNVALDGNVLAFTSVVTVVTMLVFGSVPALRGAHVPAQQALHESGRAASMSRRARRFLFGGVVAQVALTLVLLLGSGLMIRTLDRLLASDPGFAPANLVTAQVSIPPARYNAARAVGFFDELLARLRAAPGVDEAALVLGLPFAGALDSSPFEVIGRPPGEREPERHSEAATVSPGYFRAMGIPLRRGRDFDGTERAGGPIVAIIDETFADQFFPGEDPVGRTIRGYFGSDTTIIGVAGRVDHDEIGDPLKAVTYYSYRQQPWVMTRAVVVRTPLGVESAAAMLRGVVNGIDPHVPIYDVETMAGRIERSLAPRRLAMLALAVFSGLSLLLAVLGVYGVTSYTTALRTREIGIRMALGARPGMVARLIGRQGLLLAVLGTAIGTALALGATRLMHGMLFGVSPHDPVTFAAGALVLGLVTVGASLLPAVAASRVDPVRALRVD
jgi:predicted permease